MNKELTRWERRRMEHTQRRESLGLEDSDGEPISDAGPPISGEQNLWVAVILRAFMDAAWVNPQSSKYDVSKSGKKFRYVTGRYGGKPRRVYETQDIGEEKKACFEATAWLFGSSKDFYDVCFLAGYEPAAVRDAARSAEARGWPPIAAW